MNNIYIDENERDKGHVVALSGLTIDTAYDIHCHMAPSLCWVALVGRQLKSDSLICDTVMRRIEIKNLLSWNC